MDEWVDGEMNECVCIQITTFKPVRSWYDILNIRVIMDEQNRLTRG
jgi:hypothetical protein